MPATRERKPRQSRNDDATAFDSFFHSQPKDSSANNIDTNNENMPASHPPISNHTNKVIPDMDDSLPELAQISNHHSKKYKPATNQLYQIQQLAILDQDINAFLLKSPFRSKRPVSMALEESSPAQPQLSSTLIPPAPDHLLSSTVVQSQDQLQLDDGFPSFQSELVPELRYISSQPRPQHPNTNSLTQQRSFAPKPIMKLTRSGVGQPHQPPPSGSLIQLRQQHTSSRAILLSPSISGPPDDNCALNSNQPQQSEEHTTLFLLTQYRTRNRQLVLDNTSITSQLKLARRMADTLRMVNDSRFTYVRSIDKQNQELSSQTRNLIQTAQLLSEENDILKAKLAAVAPPPSKADPKHPKSPDLREIDTSHSTQSQGDIDVHPYEDDFERSPASPEALGINPDHHQEVLLQLAQAEFALGNLSIRFNSLQEAYDGLQTELAQSHSTLSDEANKVAELSQRCLRLEEISAQDSAENSSTIAHLGTQCAQLEIQLAVAKSQHGEESQLLSRSEEGLHAVTEECFQLQNGLEVAKNQILLLESEKTTLIDQLSQLTEKLERAASKSHHLLALYTSLTETHHNVLLNSEPREDQQPATTQSTSPSDPLNTGQVLTQLESSLGMKLDEYKTALIQSHSYATLLEGNQQALQQQFDDETTLLNMAIAQVNSQLSHLRDELAQSNQRCGELSHTNSQYEARSETESRLRRELLESHSKIQTAHDKKIYDLTEQLVSLQTQLSTAQVESSDKQHQFDSQIELHRQLLESSAQTMSEWVIYCDELKYELQLVKADSEQSEQLHQESLNDYRSILRQCRELLQYYAHRDLFSQSVESSETEMGNDNYGEEEEDADDHPSFSLDLVDGHDSLPKITTIRPTLRFRGRSVPHHLGHTTIQSPNQFDYIQLQTSQPRDILETMRDDLNRSENVTQLDSIVEFDTEMDL